MRSALVSGANRLFVHSFSFFCANKVLALKAISISFFCLHFNLKRWGKTAAWQIYGFLRFTRRRRVDAEAKCATDRLQIEHFSASRINRRADVGTLCWGEQKS